MGSPEKRNNDPEEEKNAVTRSTERSKKNLAMETRDVLMTRTGQEFINEAYRQPETKALKTDDEKWDAARRYLQEVYGLEIRNLVKNRKKTLQDLGLAWEVFQHLNVGTGVPAPEAVPVEKVEVESLPVLKPKPKPKPKYDFGLPPRKPKFRPEPKPKPKPVPEVNTNVELGDENDPRLQGYQKRMELTLKLAKNGRKLTYRLTPELLDALRGDLEELYAQHKGDEKLTPMRFDALCTEARRVRTQEMYKYMDGGEVVRRWRKYGTKGMYRAMFGNGALRQRVRGGFFRDNPDFMKEAHQNPSTGESSTTGEIVAKSAEASGVNPDFIKRLIYHESRGDTFALSLGWAKGMPQLTSNLWTGKDKRYPAVNPFNPFESIPRMAEYLGSMNKVARDLLKQSLERDPNAKERLKKSMDGGIYEAMQAEENRQAKRGKRAPRRVAESEIPNVRLLDGMVLSNYFVGPGATERSLLRGKFPKKAAVYVARFYREA